MIAVTILVALCTVAGLGFVLWRPQYAIVAAMTMFPLEQLFKIYFPPLVQFPWLFNAAVAGLVAMALAWRFMRGETFMRGYFNGLTFCALGLYGLAWLGLWWSPDPTNGLRMLISGVPYWILLIGILPLLVSDMESFRRILLALLVTGTFICVLILASPAANFYAGRLFIEFGAVVAMQRGNPLAVAELGGLVAVVAILYRPRYAGWFMIGVRFAAAAIGLGVAISAGARGQVVAALAAAFIMLPIARGISSPRRFIGIVGGLMVMLLAIRVGAAFFITEDNVSRWGARSFESGINTRFELVYMLWDVWVRSPEAWLQGLGTNAFYDISGGHWYVHNFIAEVLCELGLIGFLLLLGIFGFTARATLQLIRIHRDDPQLRAAVATISALAIYGFVLSLKQGTFLGVPLVIMVPFLLAKIARFEVLAEAESAYETDAADQDESEYRADGQGGEFEEADLAFVGGQNRSGRS